MASKKQPQQTPATKTLFARLDPELHEKLARMAAKATVRAGVRVTMQDIVADLVKKAPER